MDKFEAFPGVNFNFSQLIRDNVEEALSGVKGANSVKLFGNDLKTLEEVGQRVAGILAKVPGDRERRAVPHRRPAQPRDRDRPRPVRALRRQRRRRRGRGPGRHRRPCLLADGRGREALRHRAPARPCSFATTPASSAGFRSTPRPPPTAQPGPRIPLDQLATIHPHKPGASYIYRENNRRFIPIKFSVRGRDLASAIDEAKTQGRGPQGRGPLARGLPGRMVGRVRPDAGGQRPADVDHPAVDRR